MRPQTNRTFAAHAIHTYTWIMYDILFGRLEATTCESDSVCAKEAAQRTTHRYSTPLYMKLLSICGR